MAPKISVKNWLVFIFEINNTKNWHEITIFGSRKNENWVLKRLEYWSHSFSNA